ncbi:MAG: ATP-dependent metallopeptidase FtsH/Yme1/Tma family protein [SAR202 cluster bacterium]|nr:ATP-dependent metallopeptidase FtsH/Yme1/Tma family protein [SAR202 cluster bacterium]|tara:strand:- start:13978 stop:15816 length:1839 start_codon:yes stop_codon:yes gene_type:complete
MNFNLQKKSLLYLLIGVTLLTVFITFSSESKFKTEIPFSEVVKLAKKGSLQSIEVNGDRLKIIGKDDQTFTSRKEQGASVVESLYNNGIDPLTSDLQVIVKGASGLTNLIGIFLNFLPLIFLGAVLLFMFRQAQGSSNQTFSFGKSKARMQIGNQPAVNFDDVAGVEEAKEELREVVEFLKFPDRFLSLGARIPRGVLLVGPPGTGKTLLAKAVAGEAEVPFFSISGSEFVEMFVGVGASRVRDLFNQAKKHSPCIVFVDEIDAVGRHRGAGLGGGHDEREQTLNQILVEMDGFDTKTNVIVIAATNRPDILDPALLRPGRFDRRVTIDIPDVKGRVQILEVHSKGKPIGKEVDLEYVSKQTPGFSGADLANLVNESAILAARKNQKTISSEEFNESVDRVMMGPARKSKVISATEKKITAFHEAGHALVGFLLPNTDKVSKVTIVSRGHAGGYTKSLPAEDRSLWSVQQFKERMAFAMGGRAAEEINFGEITTGASNDLNQATETARAMVTKYGMSDKLGPRTFGKREEMVFLGKEISETRDYSDQIAETIDSEVKILLEEAYNTAKSLLTKNKTKLKQIADHLMEHETLEGEMLENLFNSPTRKKRQSSA